MATLTSVLRLRRPADLPITLKVFFAPGVILLVLLGLVVTSVAMLAADQARLQQIGGSRARTDAALR